MWSALFWGLFAGSSLILGGAIALAFPIRERLLGLVMAFGAGVLISAVAFELVEEAYETVGGERRPRARPRAGALVFFLGDSLDRPDGRRSRKDMAGAAVAGPAPRSCSGSCSTASPSPP